MNLEILHVDVQNFINDQLQQNFAKVAFQKNPFPSIEWLAILNQIESKTKAKEKLPTWFATKNILYPPKISIEQTSSEITARYKSNLISGTTLIDLTGGFGVDDFYFSKKFKTVVHCEINAELSAISAHNFKQLNALNIECKIGDSDLFLKQTDQVWDWIYIDPSRRNESKGKVFMLKDCLPNVPENIDFYFSKSNAILIKTAPLLDISAGLSELKNVKTIHIIALNNEVKELLWELKKDYTGNVTIKTVNSTKETEEKFEIPKNDSVANYGVPEVYLYEPNSAIMKSGAFNAISTSFNLNKLHAHSHLYTNTELIEFPGRRFKIDQQLNYNKTALKNILAHQKANITTRNFPESVENIRKKWKIKEGGNIYCFFTTDVNNHKIVLICTKI
ncbi:THUMP-like domain-containing protein [Flavobacterium sp. RSSA_27]|uniref:THUMP-like domain-containing protein n=1 Tax=Flavobacterium sp. RSSA_27 TaxID=3447667 RepID=UPI003F34B3A6